MSLSPSCDSSEMMDSGTNPVSLSQATVGCDFTIKVVDGPHCDRLRDLGFCESMTVKKLADGRNLICSVCGTRMAISRELADEVKVSPL